MFTGIIEQLGKLGRMEGRGAGARLTITHAPWPDPLVPGESVAVQGACLTVVTCAVGEFTCDVLQETLEKTCLGDKTPGSRLNLERAMRADGRFGGHMVAGHVDGTGTVTRLQPVGADWLLEVACPRSLLPEVVVKGSITIDGISLTVTAVADDRVQVHLIPFTWERTSVQALRAGVRVNIETDIIGKYVRKLLVDGAAPVTGLREDALRRAGFM